MVKPHLKLVKPTTVNRTVMPPNSELRSREYLTEAEVERLMKAARANRWGHRERDAPFTAAGFARMIERAGIEAKLTFKIHPHMLRHACGYALANRGHDTRALQVYLGHKNIQHTVRYTEMSPTRFKDF
jgi:site-specific recombinase XerD